MRKVSPFLIFPLLCTLSYRYLLHLSAFFFPNNEIQSKNTSNRFNFIVTPTSGFFHLRHGNVTMTHTFRKTKDCKQHALVIYAKWALKVGSLLVTVRVLKLNVWSKYLLLTTSYKTPNRLPSPIIFRSQWFKILWYLLSWWFNGKSWLYRLVQ